MDATALGLLLDSTVDLRVFNMNDPENAVRVVKGEDLGTLVTNSK
jgi:uridylate kinase